MGVKNFSKIFENDGEVKLKDLKNTTLYIDASVMIYRASLGMKNINMLTDSSGKSTIHISVILSNIVKFHQSDIKGVWVFDYDNSENDECHNPTKIFELAKRRKKRNDAKKALKELNAITNSNDNSDLFTDSDSDSEYNSDDNTDKKEKNRIEKNAEKKKTSQEKKDAQSKKDEDIQNEKHKQEKLAFTLSKDVVDDIKFILDCLNIQWCVSPKGFEAEQICANLTIDSDPKNTSAVYSTDADSIIYGAKILIRPDLRKKKLIKYTLDSILSKYDIDMDIMRKIAVVMGCDHCEKTKGVGVKTIFKKIQNIKLTEAQNAAVDVFTQIYDINKLNWHNVENDDNTNDQNVKKERLENLSEWLVEIRSFNKTRVSNQLAKLKIM